MTCTAVSLTVRRYRLGIGMSSLFANPSHITLYEYLNLQPLQSLEKRHWNGTFTKIHHYRFVTGLPLRDGAEALRVNWCELSISKEDDQSLLYRNSFATDLPLTQDNIAEVIAWGRARWKTDNEHNILKKGYNFEHNYGHGNKLSTVLLSLLLLAFLSHTIFALTDRLYQALRRELGSRKTFFHDIRALLRYQPFPLLATASPFHGAGARA